jgi:bifunctional DNase/RNase
LHATKSDLLVPIFVSEEDLSKLIAAQSKKVDKMCINLVFLHFLHKIGLDLFSVQVYNIRKEEILCRLLLEGGAYTKESPLSVDLKPVDMAVMAICNNTPIYVAHKVIQRIGVAVEI